MASVVKRTFIKCTRNWALELLERSMIAAKWEHTATLIGVLVDLTLHVHRQASKCKLKRPGTWFA